MRGKSRDSEFVGCRQGYLPFQPPAAPTHTTASDFNAAQPGAEFAGEARTGAGH